MESIEKAGVDESWFGEVETSGYVAGHAEIGVLVDGAGNHGGDLVGYYFVCAEDVGEGGCERGSALNGPEVDFAYTGTEGLSEVSM